MDLIFDSARADFPSTGIFVRARVGSKWDSVDIIHLTEESLLSWLRSRGGDNPWAESVVLLLLGHPQK